MRKREHKKRGQNEKRTLVKHEEKKGHEIKQARE